VIFHAEPYLTRISLQGKRTVSNMQQSSVAARNPRIFGLRAQLSTNSTTTAATEGSQSSQGPKCRPKLIRDTDFSKEGVSMDVTGGEKFGHHDFSFVVTPNPDKKLKHLRKRDSSGAIVNGESSPPNYQSDSDRSMSSIRSLLSGHNRPRSPFTNH